MDTATEVNQIIPPDEITDAVAKGRASRTGRLSITNPADLSREVLDAIHRHVPPDTVGAVIAKMLDAKRVLKNGTILDDPRTMEAGVKLYLAYMVGTPIQRSEVVSVNLDADSAVGMEERLRHSPALRQMFKQMLERVDEPSIDA
jgi:hypothetical protein